MQSRPGSDGRLSSVRQFVVVEQEGLALAGPEVRLEKLVQTSLERVRALIRTHAVGTAQSFWPPEHIVRQLTHLQNFLLLT